MTRKQLLVAPAIIALLLGGAACGRGDDKGGETGTTAPPTPAGIDPIRVLVAYTNDAWSELQAQGQDPVAHALYRIEMTNLVFSNSGNEQRVELASAAQMTTSEAIINTMPECVLGNNGVGANCAAEWFAVALETPGSEPANLRTAAQADISMLVMTDNQPGKLSGSARGLPTHLAPYDRASASIVKGSVLGFTHEIGHILGAGHDRYRRNGTTRAGLDFGETFTPIESRTVMAYAEECDDVLGLGECTQIPWFTNPLATVHGQAIGDLLTEYNACVVEYYGGTAADYYEMSTGAIPYTAPAAILACPFVLSDTYNLGGDLCEDSYSIITDADLATLAPCGTVRGNVTITDAVTSVSSLTSLNVVTGRLTIDAAAVTSLTGLSNLQSVGVLQIESPISSLGSLSHLVQVDSLEIDGATISSLGGLEGVRLIQDVTLENLTSLTSLDGLDGVGALDSLRVDNCDSLADLSGLEHIDRIGTLEIENNDQLFSLGESYWLDSVLGIRIVNNPVLWSLAGLESAGALMGELTLSQNSSLNDINALAGVTHASELTVTNMDMLDTLYGLSGIATVDGEVHINENDLLDTLGLLSLTSASYISIWGNPFLTSCDLPSLQAGVLYYCDLGQ